MKRNITLLTVLLLVVFRPVAGVGAQTDHELPLRTQRLSEFKDTRLEIRETNIHEYNIEAFWEKPTEIGQ